MKKFLIPLSEPSFAEDIASKAKFCGYVVFQAPASDFLAREKIARDMDVEQILKEHDFQHFPVYGLFEDQTPAGRTAEKYEKAHVALCNKPGETLKPEYFQDLLGDAKKICSKFGFEKFLAVEQATDNGGGKPWTFKTPEWRAADGTKLSRFEAGKEDLGKCLAEFFREIYGREASKIFADQPGSDLGTCLASMRHQKYVDRTVDQKPFTWHEYVLHNPAVDLSSTRKANVEF